MIEESQLGGGVFVQGFLDSSLHHITRSMLTTLSCRARAHTDTSAFCTHLDRFISHRECEGDAD